MNQKIGLFYEKIDAIIRKVDYDEPAEIKRRIGKCDDAIKRLKTEYDAVHNREKDKAGDKRDMHQYNAVTIIKALTNIATAFISVNVGNAIRSVLLANKKVNPSLQTKRQRFMIKQQINL